MGCGRGEIADLQWSQVEYVRRAKNGKPSAHPLRGDEVRALRELRRQFPDSTFVFATERCGPFTPDAVNWLIKRIGVRAGLPSVHAHMLRHGCGYALANAGHDTRAIQDWLGHRSITHTVRYTELARRGSGISGASERERARGDSAGMRIFPMSRVPFLERNKSLPACIRWNQCTSARPVAAAMLQQA